VAGAATSDLTLSGLVFFMGYTDVPSMSTGCLIVANPHMPLVQGARTAPQAACERFHYVESPRVRRRQWSALLNATGLGLKKR
jgi:hypothetical protein